MPKGSNHSLPTKEGMPCFYPEGNPADWCERHAAETPLHGQAKRAAHA